jgi:hypothetical protein
MTDRVFFAAAGVIAAILVSLLVAQLDPSSALLSALHGAVSAISFLLFLALSAAVYFLPAIVAWKRNHRNTAAIFALNLFLGWTLIGWVAALVWALTNDTSRAPA